jgi:hypothetical protein
MSECRRRDDSQQTSDDEKLFHVGYLFLEFKQPALWPAVFSDRPDLHVAANNVSTVAVRGPRVSVCMPFPSGLLRVSVIRTVGIVRAGYRGVRPIGERQHIPGAKFRNVRLGKSRRRDDGQQARDDKKLLHFTSPVLKDKFFLASVSIVERKHVLGDTVEIRSCSMGAIKLIFTELNSP